MSQELSPKQLKASALIGGGTPKKTAAESVGVTPQTVSEWMRQPAFLSAVNRAKHQMMKDTQDCYRALATDAVTTMQDLMQNSTDENVRLRAAVQVIKDMKLVYPHIGGWDIGPTTEADVLREQRKEANPSLSSLLGNMI